MKSSSILSYVHTLLRAAISPGDVVIDATAGNGHDTLFLATCVGSSGVVYAFDIQSAALHATAAITENAGADIRLRLAGHQHMAEQVDAEHHGGIRAVVFNLGYLPSGDKGVTTTADTTTTAVQQAIDLLAPNGVLAIVCYLHDQGRVEYDALLGVLAALPQHQATVLECRFRNQQGNPPVAFVVTKQPHTKATS